MDSFDYTVSTQKSVDDAAASVERLAGHRGYKVLVVHDIAATLSAKGFHIPPLRIVEICNPKYAYKALTVDPRISLMLPCPISVYTDKTGTRISTILPTKELSVTSDNRLYETAAAVENDLKAIVEEAAMQH